MSPSLGLNCHTRTGLSVQCTSAAIPNGTQGMLVAILRPKNSSAGDLFDDNNGVALCTNNQSKKLSPHLVYTSLMIPTALSGCALPLG